MMFSSNPPELHLLTLQLIMSAIRASGACPALGRTSTQAALTPEQERSSFSRSTFPIKPVAPVMRTFFPSQYSGMVTILSAPSLLCYTPEEHQQKHCHTVSHCKYAHISQWISLFASEIVLFRQYAVNISCRSLPSFPAKTSVNNYCMTLKS